MNRSVLHKHLCINRSVLHKCSLRVKTGVVCLFCDVGLGQMFAHCGIIHNHSTNTNSNNSLFVFSCVQCFRVSVIHQTLARTTGSLTCVRSYACVYAQGWSTPTMSQHYILTRKNSQFVLVLRMGFEPVMESTGFQGRHSTN